MEQEHFHVIGISPSSNDQFFVDKDVPSRQCFSYTMNHDADAILCPNQSQTHQSTIQMSSLQQERVDC
jgi:hypothetical protein